MTAAPRLPGVSWEELFPEARPALLTGVPVFLGHAAGAGPGGPVALSAWPQFAPRFGGGQGAGFLHHAVRGFFENGGRLCFVVALDRAAPPAEALAAGLRAAADLDGVDLVCAPDLAWSGEEGGARPIDPALQQQLLDHCRAAGDRFAILDGPVAPAAEAMRQRAALRGDFGALYYPWIAVGRAGRAEVLAPPCGHVAGVYARADARVGVHKAPANEVVEGAVNVVGALGRAEQLALFAADVNTILPLAGRGIRIWGARTLSDDPAWRHVNIRRLFISVGRWLARFMDRLTFEPNDVRLWARIMRELSAYFDDLYRRGALAGARPEQAYYVKCDRETTPPEALARGELITEIGLAPAAPSEFIEVRIIRTASGARIEAPRDGRQQSRDSQP